MLLSTSGIACEAVASDIDERSIQQASGLRSPGDVATLLARQKALDVARRRPGCVVIGADQTLAAGGRMFNKPADRTAAIDQLRGLSGRTHDLHSAVAVATEGDVAFVNVTVARMTMRALSDDAISTYLDAAGDAVTSSVGGYQLEGLGVHLFDQIEGDHFTILGLPLLPLLRYFRSQGWLTL